ncbi:MAG: cytochrome c [Bacteroidota bacterium]
MKNKILSVITVCLLIIAASCNNTSSDKTTQSTDKKDTAVASDKGIGRFTNVKLNHPLDETMITKGSAVYNAKCIACHKLSNEKLVGPGYKGVCDKRTPEWIMNFITNTNVMLDSDLVAQQLMVVCLARMPNQNLSDEDARNTLEFLLKNDGKN